MGWIPSNLFTEAERGELLALSNAPGFIAEVDRIAGRYAFGLAMRSKLGGRTENRDSLLEFSRRLDAFLVALEAMPRGLTNHVQLTAVDRWGGQHDLDEIQSSLMQLKVDTVVALRDWPKLKPGAEGDTDALIAADELAMAFSHFGLRFVATVPSRSKARNTAVAAMRAVLEAGRRHAHSGRKRRLSDDTALDYVRQAISRRKRQSPEPSGDCSP